jgi:hypothetical protein
MELAVLVVLEQMCLGVALHKVEQVVTQLVLEQVAVAVVVLLLVTLTILLIKRPKTLMVI